MCIALYVCKTTNILQRTSTSTQVSDQTTGFSALSIIKKAVAPVVTPEPLQIKKLLGLSSDSSKAVTVSGAIERTNYERAQNSLGGLTESLQLDASAQVKAEDILKRQYFEHTAPDGKTVSDLVEAQGYEYVRVGENLALGDFTDNADLLTAWMNSPGHRANILDKRYQEIGIGVAYGNYQGRYVAVAVQHFGRPRSACPDVDENLKNQVQNMQSQITKLSSALTILKTEIDTKRASGAYVDNTVIDAYNNTVAQYENLIKQSNNIRDMYNKEINAFNECLSAL